MIAVKAERSSDAEGDDDDGVFEDAPDGGFVETVFGAEVDLGEEPE
jgi:hypothetical protein